MFAQMEMLELLVFGKKIKNPKKLGIEDQTDSDD
jgi:hypothetical protein